MNVFESNDLDWERRTTGLRLNFSTLWPSGRPRWDIRMTEAAPNKPQQLRRQPRNNLTDRDHRSEWDAPLSMACLMVGRAATIRCERYVQEEMTGTLGQAGSEGASVSLNPGNRSEIDSNRRTAGLVIAPVDLSWGTLKSVVEKGGRGGRKVLKRTSRRSALCLANLGQARSRATHRLG